jgi:hypothetical protein
MRGLTLLPSTTTLQLHSLDLAPAHGGDTTSNLLESTPAKQVLARDTCVPAGDTLPFLYLGSQHLGLEHDKVHRVGGQA